MAQLHRTLLALSVDAALPEVIAPGVVLAVHRRAATLLTDAGTVVTLADRALGNGPLTVVLDFAGLETGAAEADQAMGVAGQGPLLVPSHVRFATGVVEADRAMAVAGPGPLLASSYASLESSAAEADQAMAVAGPGPPLVSSNARPATGVAEAYQAMAVAGPGPLLVSQHGKLRTSVVEEQPPLASLHASLATSVAEADQAMAVAGPGPLLAELYQGQRFVPVADGLRFDDGPTLLWRSALRWRPADSAPSGRPRLRRADWFADVLEGYAGESGLLPVVLGRSSGPPIQQALARKAGELLARLPDQKAIVGLIGLGPGLTPAGDDLIAGLVLVLGYAGHPLASMLRPLLHTAATTRLSSAMLGWASEGVAGEHVLLLLRALCEGSDGEVLATLGPVLAHGATSGADLAAGLLVGLRIVECSESEE